MDSRLGARQRRIFDRLSAAGMTDGGGVRGVVSLSGDDHDGLTIRGRPPLDPSRASATVVIVKGIQVSKELVA